MTGVRSTLLLALAGALLASSPTHAQRPRDQGVSLGAGVVFAPRPFEGVDTELFPVPLLNYRRGGFYAQGLEVGYRWLRRSPFIVTAFAAPSFEGYQAKDSPALAGMDDRDPSVGAGFALGLAMRRFELEYKASWDVVDRSDGSRKQLELRFPRRAGRWLVTPAVSAIRLDDDWVDYHYGVRPAEEILGARPAYRGTATTNYALSLFVLRGAERWSCFAGVEAQKLGSDIEDSPIVDEERTTGGVAGVLFKLGKRRAARDTRHRSRG